MVIGNLNEKQAPGAKIIVTAVVSWNLVAWSTKYITGEK